MKKPFVRALILGGTKGLGLAVADRAVAQGVTPVVIGRSAASVAKLDRIAIAADLSQPVDWHSVDFLDGVQYLFVCVGMFMKKPFVDCLREEVDAIAATNLVGMMTNVRRLHRLMCMQRPLADAPGQPYHFVMISSTSSWRARDNETVYAALCAARSHFTRNFARELVRDLPGSKTTLVHPGGMDNPHFWAGTGQDTTKFMKAEDVSGIIWNRVLGQVAAYDEFAVIRQPDGSPRVQDGPQAPEMPL